MVLVVNSEATQEVRNRTQSRDIFTITIKAEPQPRLSQPPPRIQQLVSTPPVENALNVIPRQNITKTG
jgi:hypothetical protein